MYAAFCFSIGFSLLLITVLNTQVYYDVALIPPVINGMILAIRSESNQSGCRYNEIYGSDGPFSLLQTLTDMYHTLKSNETELRFLADLFSSEPARLGTLFEYSNTLQASRYLWYAAIAATAVASLYFLFLTLSLGRANLILIIIYLLSKVILISSYLCYFGFRWNWVYYSGDHIPVDLVVSLLTTFFICTIIAIVEVIVTINILYRTYKYSDYIQLE